MGSSYLRRLKTTNRNLIEENKGLKAELENTFRYKSLYKECKDTWETKFEEQEKSFRASLNKKDLTIKMKEEMIDELKEKILNYADSIVEMVRRWHSEEISTEK